MTIKRLSAGLAAAAISLTLTMQATPAQAAGVQLVDRTLLTGLLCPSPAGWTQSHAKYDDLNVFFDDPGSTASVQCRYFDDTRAPDQVLVEDFEGDTSGRYQSIEDKRAEHFWWSTAEDTKTGDRTQLVLVWEKQPTGQYIYRLMSWQIPAGEKAELVPAASEAIQRFAQAITFTAPEVWAAAENPKTLQLGSTKLLSGISCPTPKDWAIDHKKDVDRIFAISPTREHRWTCQSYVVEGSVTKATQAKVYFGPMLSDTIVLPGGEFGANGLHQVVIRDAKYKETLHQTYVFVPVQQDGRTVTMRAEFSYTVKDGLEKAWTDFYAKAEKKFLDQFRAPAKDDLKPATKPTADKSKATPSKPDTKPTASPDKPQPTAKPDRGVEARTGVEGEVPVVPLALLTFAALGGAGLVARRRH